MVNYKIVCFYTKETPYELESEGLKESCQMFDLPCYRQGYDSRGKWVRNAAIKPEFLLEMLEKYSPQDLLYLDVDARVRKYPSIFDHFDGDIGVFFLKHPNESEELISATIYLKNIPRVKKVIEAWVEAQKKQPEEWDQVILQKVLPDFPDVKVVNLPPTYCHMLGIIEDKEPPVIEQLQASRCYQELMDPSGSKVFFGHPVQLGNVLVRFARDGTLYLTQRDAAAEGYLDEHYNRIPGALRWMPKKK